MKKKDFKIQGDYKIGLDTVYSRWYVDDGTGGTCSECNRHFGSSDALEDHQEFCRDLLEKKLNAAEKTGVFEEVDDEDESWSDGRIGEHSSWFYAETSLSYLKEQYPNRDYNLVKPGPNHTVGGSSVPMVHLNFKAKPNDGPVETFFAQLRLCLGRHREQSVVDCCLSLGASQSLPPSDSDYYGNCKYCPAEAKVRHPDHECAELDMGYNSDNYISPSSSPPSPSSSYESES